MITRHTALIIQSNEVLIDAAGPAANGKFSLYLATDHIRPLITTEPIFETAADAKSNGEALVAEIRSMDVLHAKTEVRNDA